MRRPVRRSRRDACWTFLLGAVLASGSCSADDRDAEAAGRAAPAARAAGLAVYAPYIPTPAGDAAALYLEVADTSGRGDRLLGAACDAAAGVALHRTTQVAGRVGMEPVSGGLTVPPHGSARLAPGGAHIMLTGLSRALAAGEILRVELRFERAGVVAVDVPIVSWAEAGRRMAESEEASP